MASLSPVRAPAGEIRFLRSARSGNWSDPATWEGGTVPGRRERIQVRAGHTVVYDVKAGPVVRFLHVAGTLTFAHDRDTKLDVGLILVEPGEFPRESGFGCSGHGREKEQGESRPAFLVGTPEQPIAAGRTAVIRLHYLEGMDRRSCPAIVCCGGRMEFHGAPMNRTWLKLGGTARPGDSQATLAEEIQGWKAGDRLILTATKSDRLLSGTRRPGGNVEVRTEERILRKIEGKVLTLDRPLRFEHLGEGDFRGAVANLSRNVVVESADPDGLRGHTMYHRGSAGSISYAEFRHLGKEGVLGRYAIHFHLCGNSMRGSYVQGASIWDSNNRWVTIHGTNHLLVRDCVGYRSVGHGFFLEDGTETYNMFDRNLAVQAFVGRPLPNQALPFDANDGAGFWWANSFNAFTGNATCENDRYGYRFEASATPGFSTVLPVLFPDGKKRSADVRTLPFLKFDDNESCCDGKYGFNLGEGVQRFGPDSQHPFLIRNMKIWEARYAFRPASPCVLVENMHIRGCDYGIYTPNYDRHVYRGLTIEDTVSEPFNRGEDDDSVQYGSVTVEGLTFRNNPHTPIPLIQITDNNPTGRAEVHIRGLKRVDPTRGRHRALVDLGGGVQVRPKTPFCVPIYLHDWYGKGRHARVVSVLSRNMQEGVAHREEPPWIGPGARIAAVGGVKFPELLDPVDDMPPGTIITRVAFLEPGKLLVAGTATDNGRVVRVVVNGVEAKSRRADFADWEAVLEVTEAGRLRIEARAEDAAGNIEPAPHRVTMTVR